MFVGTAPAGEIVAREPLQFAEPVTVIPGGRYFVGAHDAIAIGTLPDFTFDVLIPVSAPARDIVVDEAGTRAYFVGGYSNGSDATVQGSSVLELDATSGEILRSFLGDLWSHAVTPDGTHLYTVGFSGPVSVLTLNTGVQRPGPEVWGTDLTFSPDGRFLYVLQGSDHIIGSKLYIIDRASGVTVRTVTLGGLTERIAMAEDGTAIISNWPSSVDFVR